MKKRISIILCMIISVSMVVSACGIFGAKKYPDPQETLDDLLTALSEGDIEATTEIAEDIGFDLSDYDEQTQDLLLYYYELTTIEVNGEPEYKGKKVDLSVTATVPDIKACFDVVIDSENSEFFILMVKDLLLGTINGEDATSTQEEMYSGIMGEIKAQMHEPGNQISTESTIEMSLNEDEDGWIIDEVSGDFLDPAADDFNSDDVATATEKAIIDAIPAALDLLLEEGSIDQAMYDAIKAAM